MNSRDGTLLVYGGNISENQAVAGSGGGVLNDGGWLGVLEPSTFLSNSADNAGGAIAVTAGGLSHIEFATVNGNSAEIGGGISASGDGTIVVSQSNLLTNNTARRGVDFPFQMTRKGPCATTSLRAILQPSEVGAGMLAMAR